MITRNNSEFETFPEAFELASRYAGRNDAYRFYFTYNIALSHYARSLQLQKGTDAYLYTPGGLIDAMNNGLLRRDHRNRT